MRLTDMADELYTAATDLPGGVRAATAKRGGVTVTRVEIAREGLEKPRGRYVTLEVPSVSVLDERDAEVIEQAADELRALLPPEGPVLVLGVVVERYAPTAVLPVFAGEMLLLLLLTVAVELLVHGGLLGVIALARLCAVLAIGVVIQILFIVIHKSNLLERREPMGLRRELP